MKIITVKIIRMNFVKIVLVSVLSMSFVKIGRVKIVQAQWYYIYSCTAKPYEMK